MLVLKNDILNLMAATEQNWDRVMFTTPLHHLFFLQLCKLKRPIYVILKVERVLILSWCRVSAAQQFQGLLCRVWRLLMRQTFSIGDSHAVKRAECGLALSCCWNKRGCPFWKRHCLLGSVWTVFAYNGFFKVLLSPYRTSTNRRVFTAIQYCFFWSCPYGDFSDPLNILMILCTVDNRNSQISNYLSTLLEMGLHVSSEQVTWGERQTSKEWFVVLTTTIPLESE